MTPSNGILTEEQLLIVYDAILKNGYKIKPVYLMRDPIERLWSQTKMFYFNQIMKKQLDQAIDKNRLFDLFVNIAKEDFKAKEACRTRYDLIIPKIEKVFNQEKIFFYFSEDMRGDIFKSELFKFLELDSLPTNNKILGNPSDISISSNEIPKNYLDQVYELYKPVYLYIHNKFRKNSKKLGK